MIWAFDVDGTLIGSVRSDRLRPGARELLAALAARGVTVVLWSAGGEEYARRMAQRHGLAAHVAGYHDKGVRDGADHYRLPLDVASDGERQQVTFVDDSPVDLPPDVGVIAVAQFIGGNPADRVLVDLACRLDDLLA